MYNQLDLAGKRFGRLVAIKQVGSSNSHGALWECLCDCGNTFQTRTNYLTTGGTQSCGCIRRELSAKKARIMGEKNVSHGFSRRSNRHPLYFVWHGMRGRCNYPSHISYKNYGAKGIKVCEEWNDFKVFCEWAMNNGWKKGLALDRIDPNADYKPSNCRFITQAENNRRRDDIIWIEHDGKRKTILQWSEETGLKACTIRYRYKQGLSPKEILDPNKRERAKR